MSDNEGPAKKGGYRVEYASSSRSKCRGPKPCTGTDIPKGSLRLGSLVEIKGIPNYSWRHWGCVTSKLMSNMKERLGDVEELDGFDELRDEDKDRIRRAFEEGKVADADVPPSAGDTAEGEKPKKKRAHAKKKTETEAEEGGDEKPKKAPARKPRAKKAIEAEDGAESEEKPKKAITKKTPVEKKAPAEKKAPTKRRATKKKEESEDSGEDFAEAIADVEEDEEDEVVQAPKNKRKRPTTSTTTSKPASSSKKPKTTSSRAKKSKAVESDDED